MTAEHTTTQAVGLVVLLVLSVVAGSVVLTGVVGADEHESAELPQDSLTEQRGDVVTVDVELNNTTTAYVSMTREDRYGVLVEVVDGDEDGHVGLTLNTHYARMNDETAGVGLTDESEAAGDEVTVVDVTTPSDAQSPLPVGTYDVAVGTELDGNELADEQDTMEVTLEAGSIDGMRIWTAPYGLLSFDTREEFVEEVGQSGLESSVTETDRIAAGDYLVVQVDASGIYGQVSTRHDLMGIDEFGEDSGLSLDIYEVNPETSEEVRRVDLSSRDNVLVVDEANDTMFLVVNTNTDTFVPNTAYQATFQRNETNALVADSDPDEEDGESVSATFAVVDRDATLQTDGTFPQSANTTLRGTTSVAPGSRLTLELNSTNETETDALPTSQTVTVADDGTFDGSLDLSDVPNGTNVTASVVWNDEVIGNATGVVTQPVEDDAETTTSDSESTAEPTTTESASTPTPEPTPAPTTTSDGAMGTGESGGEGTGDAAATQTQSQSPGFGLVSALVALVVLLGAAVLASRVR
ncbi:hypothetical protein SAMN04487950_4177 [Halogranum rubrum]|uniref:DUF7827 domain-containing protein n=1 Tax=Halogranum rubrum TaxID=553466 RepID=A0A1I4ILB4_9EURY|nr:BGTF surface domain-containing protein [Halogranum rubrum]SFL55128.1 hypothetical protein SAMN04487950_4177 [Halogranum rubrum]